MTDTRLYKMQSITSDQLAIDRASYQRKRDKDKIARIVSNWDERVANEPKISCRDGQNFVFDGQHTVLAREALNGGGPTEILCKVYTGMTAQDEARLFALQTGCSSKPRSGETLRANLFSEQEEALAFTSATESVGIQINLKGIRLDCQLACVSTALNAYRELGEELYIEAMRILYKAWDGKSDSLRFEIVKAVTEFVGTYAKFYDKERLVSALNAVKKPIKIRDNINTDLKHPKNQKYIYQIWKLYNDYEPSKKLKKLF